MSYRENVPNIVGITGHAQHGKDTVGRVFVGLGFKQVGFADALRELMLRVNPYVDGLVGSRYHEVLRGVGYEGAKAEYPEVRRVLMELGTGVRDIVGVNAWVTALMHKLLPGEKYVVTDVRFPNEVSAITAAGGEVWRVERLGFDNGLGTDHPSEAFIDDFKCTVNLKNDGDIAELQEKVKSIIGARGLS